MKRVLVVERHSEMLDALSDLVAEEPGLELTGTVRTVREAISLARRLRPDVVLIDVDQPSWTAQWLNRVLSEFPFALLVRLTAATDPEMECPESLANSPCVLKTAIPDFLRSLSK